MYVCEKELEPICLCLFVYILRDLSFLEVLLLRVYLFVYLCVSCLCFISQTRSFIFLICVQKSHKNCLIKDLLTIPDESWDKSVLKDEGEEFLYLSIDEKQNATDLKVE